MPNISQTQSSCTQSSCTQSSCTLSTTFNSLHTKQRPNSLLRFTGIISSSSNLKINLVEPILFIRGSPQESTGCFLRGELCLNLSKPMKIKKIEMKFVGKLKTFWPEGKISYNANSNRNDLCEKREIITHDWTFLAPITSSDTSNVTQYQLLPAGIHTYPFELFLPGNLPETIKAYRGNVTYKLVANVVRQGFLPNVNITRYVPIVRTLLDEQNSQGLSVSNTKESLNYEISIPRRAYALGDTIEIDVKLRPTVKNLRVIGGKIELNEDSTYKAGTQKYREINSLSSLQVKDYGEQRIPMERRNINEGDLSNNTLEDEYIVIPESDLEDENVYYHNLITFPIPKRTNSTHPSCKSSSITITHQLKFTFTTSELLTNGTLKKRKKTEVKVEIPVILLSCRCASDELPTYEEGEYLGDSGYYIYGESNLDSGYTSEGSESHLERSAVEPPPSYYDLH
ncbi:9847_t:CDS:2 [Acaulospora morrowiae]|uniref:9847_t:CDS:1 n=1 Tax=Acaulospora morrowiae TaxID=94023 RepID=A0A9N9FSP9_9GLOM|nr:9847_t:CDS:2 [Acaulospora morrowiae]